VDLPHPNQIYVDAVAPSYFNQVTLTQVCACVYKTSDYVG